MKLKKCIKCSQVPKMKKEDEIWTIGCKCGPERTIVVTGNTPRETAIAQYNLLMCKDEKKDVIITITIPADEKNTPISIGCNCENDNAFDEINRVRKQIVSLLKDFAK